MHGPIAAAMRSRLAPSCSISAMVESVTPARAPRQPACAAATIPASRSANSTGAQSAVRIPSSRPGRSVTIASALRPLVVRHGAVDVDRIARMHLEHRRQLGARQHRRDRAPAVLGDRVAVVVAAGADVQPFENAARNPAAPAEEAVRDAGKARGPDRLDRHSFSLMTISSSA